MIPAIVVLEQIEQLVIDVVTFYHDTFPISWGMSIVLLTVTVRVAMLPLAIKQLRSMAAMQRIQPKVKELQNRYKGKRDRESKTQMQQELMALYREHKVNPFSSCLPLLVQAPVFIGLYRALSGFDPVGDRSFLFVPNIFIPVNDLPTWKQAAIVAAYSLSMLGSALLFSFVTDRQQKMIFASMSVIFIPFILSVPVGVAIYWITTNLWTIGQQGVAKRWLGHHFPAVQREKEKKKAGEKRSSRNPPKETAGRKRRRR